MPVYGKHAQPGFPIVEQRGNQCGIVLGLFAPCLMEATVRAEPDADTCLLLEGVRRVRTVALTEARLLKDLYHGELHWCAGKGRGNPGIRAHTGPCDIQEA